MKFAHNDQIKNNTPMDTVVFIERCHEASDKLSIIAQKLADESRYGHNDITEKSFQCCLKSVFSGTVEFIRESINLEGDSSDYGSISFLLDGAIVQDLYFEKPTKKYQAHL